jgi:anion-transporting  ArsA/GET3 family ATPase
VKIRIFVGTGGVGKTSVTAASALRSALDGKKSLVLTIDPALRLRSALGLTGAALEQRVELGPIHVEKIQAKGELWAALLDVPSAMNRMVRAHVRPDKAREISSHPVYRLMLTSLAGMNELLAVERIRQAMADGFENLFIDTAPSRHAFEFLDKPEFFVQLVSFPLIRLIGRTFGLWRKGRAPVDAGSTDGDIYGKVEQLIGAPLAGQILEFFSIFQPVAEGYASSARDTIGLLRDSRSTAFTIVSSPARARQDGNYFFTELTKRGYSVEQLIVNRLWPEWDMKSAPGASDATRELIGWYENVCAAQRAGRDKAAAAWHRGKGPRVIDLPEMARNVDGIAALASIAEHL